MVHKRIHKKEDLPEGKLAMFWILGSAMILWGAWIAGHIEWTLGTTPLSYYGSLIFAFLLILFGGLCWIGISVRVSHQ